MKLTIRNKLVAGFAGVLVLMTAMAAVAGYAVYTLRRSAQEATRVGGQLNALALEIQVHNLEAEKRIKAYLTEAKVIGAKEAREKYLGEADFEVSEIQSLVGKATDIAPTPEKRATFEKLAATLVEYEKARNAAVEATEHGSAAGQLEAALEHYETAAESLHENAEDGEVVGQDASQVSQDEIARISQQSVSLVIGISLVGLLLGAGLSYRLSRAILVPVDHLKTVAENVSLGNLDMAVRRYSDDEIGDLADSFSRMVTAVKFFRMEAELSQEVSDGGGKAR